MCSRDLGDEGSKTDTNFRSPLNWMYLGESRPIHKGTRKRPGLCSRPAEGVYSYPDGHSDLGPKSRRRNGLLVRIARGLYRYGPSGAIYLCRKVSGKNVWRSLQTNDRTRAMAIPSLQNYVSVQNGNHELITFPEGVSPSPERQINLVFEGAPATAPTVRSAAYFGCRGRDCWYNFFL